MKVNDMLILGRQRLGDMQKVTFSDAELLYCLNNAMDDLCNELAENYSPEILKTLTVPETGQFQLPDDFIAWQGQYPLNYVTNDENQTTVTTTGPEWDGTTPTLYYYASKKHFTSLEDTIPFRTLTQQQNLLKKLILQVKGNSANDSTGAAQSNSGQGQA